ncbi:MAG: biotin/lipoyl-containing protein, partial [Pseudomonadota bacterium]
MIAKLITHGPSRDVALSRLTAALEATEVAGSTTNLSFLAALTRHEGFASGAVDTGLIARDLDVLLAADQPHDLSWEIAALHALQLVERQDETPDSARSPFAALGPWRLWGQAESAVLLRHGENACEIRVRQSADRAMTVQVQAIEGDGEIQSTDLKQIGPGRFRTAGRVVSAKADCNGKNVTTFIEGRTDRFEILDPLEGGEATASSGDAVHAPMSGLVKLVSAAPGQQVAKGEALLVLEAMKMEHQLTSPRDGVLAEIHATPGSHVSEGDLLLALEPIDE